MQYINIGKLVNTHGIKGEVRIISDFRYKKNVFINNFKLYIGNNKDEYEIVSYRHHKNFEMVTFKGYDNINLVEHLKGSFVYINKDDLVIQDNKVLAIDLIGFNVIIEGKQIGMVLSIIDTYANEVLVLDSKIMIPYVDEFIINIDKDNKIINVKYMKGLI